MNNFLVCNKCGGKNISLTGIRQVKEKLTDQLKVRLTCECGEQDIFFISSKDFIVWSKEPTIKQALREFKKEQLGLW